MHASNSPNGRALVDLPRRGDSYGQVSIAESFALSQGPPASSRMTSAPACVRAWAAMPPPAPEPTMQTSYSFAWLTVGDPSDGARLDGFSQRAERVARGHELVRYESPEPRVGDSGRDRVPVELLGAVQLVATGNAPRMKMGDVFPVAANGPVVIPPLDLLGMDFIRALTRGRAPT